MDIKIKGVTEKILKEALAQAKKARLEILDMMEKVIDKPRTELSKYAPKIEIMYIAPEKIKDVIGRGGEMITKIIQEASNVVNVNDKDAVKVELEDSGRVIIYHNDFDVIKKTKSMIESVVREVIPGEIYSGKVVKVEEFGCFVELWQGCEGLVHISQLAEERVNKVKDIVNVGDEIIVKALGFDNRGRLNLSRKEALPKKKEEENEKTKKKVIKKDEK